jgi:D-alanyl-D-alanine carboxypeptidase/D-alanyl-D-alanine-endopeptidase (penicillin-binding protein 4)
MTDHAAGEAERETTSPAEAAQRERRLDGRLDDRVFEHLIRHDQGPGTDGADANIQLVAEPARYPRSPLVALLAITIVPAVVLALLVRWSDEKADEYERSREALTLLENRLSGSVSLGGTTPEAPDDDEAVVDGTDPALATTMFDFRRTPGVVTDIARAERLRSAVDPVLTYLGDQSCAAVSVDGTTVTARNPQLPVVPASNQKLLVATAALEILGPDHTFATSVAVPAAVDGVIEGDIYLIGGGDPLLTSLDFDVTVDAFPVVDPTPLDVLADAIADAGITRIRGSVIGDGSRYDDEFVVDEWSPGVALVEAGPYDALMVNDARVRGRSSRESDPNDGAAREFVRLLNARDVRVDNNWGSGVASNLVPTLATVQSAPLSAVVAEMLTTSDNNTAELLLKEIGVATAEEGTRAAGLAAMEETLGRLGVPLEGVTMRDGSGLSPANRVTCAAVLKLIQLGAGGPLDSALPVAATSGTLAGEFVDTTMAGRLRAKTGSLTDVKALAGYVDPVESSAAGTIEFVLISNDVGIAEVTAYRPLWEAFGDRLATYPAGPDASALGPR